MIENRFTLAGPYVTLLGKKVEETVFNFCMENKFAYLGRSKDLQSLAEKIESGRYSNWDELDDLFACTIIVPTLAAEEGVIEFLERVFSKTKITRRGEHDKAPDVFRFDSTRFIGRLRMPDGVDEPSHLHDIRFEVQIRSAFEHAWSVTTHALAYKSNNVDWATLRVAAQLKAAVEQLDSLVLTYDQLTQRIVTAPWPDVELKSQIAERFTMLVASQKIPSEAAPKDWSRFGENLYSLLKSSPHYPANWRERPKFITNCLDLLTVEIEKISSMQFPRSISLHQLSLGILMEHGCLGPTLKRFIPIITPELQMLYPSVKNLTARFLFETDPSPA